MRLLIIDPQPLFREGLKAVLRDTGQFTVAAEAGDGRSGLRTIDKVRPDLVVLDLVLPTMDGLTVIREVRHRSAPPAVFVLTQTGTRRSALDAFAAGAIGFALKTDAIPSIIEGLAAASRGIQHASPALGCSVADLQPGAAPEPNVLSGLSLRERDVFALIIKGRTTREIARELCISHKTVDSHRTHINEKLGCRSAADIVRFAAVNGLLDDARAAATLWTGADADERVVSGAA